MAVKARAAPAAAQPGASPLEKQLDVLLQRVEKVLQPKGIEVKVPDLQAALFICLLSPLFHPLAHRCMCRCLSPPNPRLPPLALHDSLGRTLYISLHFHKSTRQPIRISIYVSTIHNSFNPPPFPNRRAHSPTHVYHLCVAASLTFPWFAAPPLSTTYIK